MFVKTHTTEIRVRYEETDRMGVSYYGNYFTWFEVARTDYFRGKGISYRRLEEEEGIGLMVVSASCRYIRPSTYDDVLTVESRISEIKNTSLVFAYNIRRGTDLVASGETSHVFTDRSRKPCKIPAGIKKALSVST